VKSEIEWAKMTAADLKSLAALPKSTAILVTGSLEQHGPHLPVSTDTVGAETAARDGALIASPQLPVTLLPSLWAGLSEYHIPFGGTISLDYATWHAMLRCVVRSLHSLGFKRLLIVNGHGGNIAPLEISVRELSVAFSMPIVATTPWFNVQLDDVMETDEVVEHACEAETSLMLALLPEAVDQSKFEEAAAPHPHRRPQKGFTRFYSFTDCAPITGTWGDPRPATASKGHVLRERLGRAVADILLNDDIWFAVEDVWAPRA
jgi:creatinine amidohydrolase